MDFKNLDKYIKTYLKDLKKLKEAGHKGEGNTRRCLSTILSGLSKDNGLLFVDEYGDKSSNDAKKNIAYDGVIKKDKYPLCYWEAKDEDDDLEEAIKEKFKAGYKDQNILFENTKRAVLYQNGNREKEIDDLEDKSKLRSIIEAFFRYDNKALEAFLEGKENFKDKIEDISKEIFNLLEGRKNESKEFKALLAGFQDECKKTLNPSIGIKDIENMLVQHIITEKCFASIMGEHGFFADNPISKHIEEILKEFYDRETRNKLTVKLDKHYEDISSLANKLPKSDFASRQFLLNDVYEIFFQGFSKDDADRLGIVYTPPQIVDFILESTNHILQKDFGKSLKAKGVHILDPCVGTGNFIIHLIEKIAELDVSNLEYKYNNDLHCNEISLLPYYVANLNIEKTYEKLRGKLEDFKGICLVDTLELTEDIQGGLFAKENVERVKGQQDKDIFLIIGNPPYNAWQKSENEDNKNKAHTALDKIIKDKYVKHSTAQNNNALYDPYVKFFRFATERLKSRDGIIAFITNNSFVDGYAFDGFRKSLSEDFNEIIHIDLGGNVRKGKDPNNVFDIMVGVGISFLIKKKGSTEKRIRYYKVEGEEGGLLKKEEKLAFLSGSKSIENIEFRGIKPNSKANWFSERLGGGFDDFIPIGDKDKKRKEKLFSLHSNGVKTQRDKIVYDFNENKLEEKVSKLIELYDLDLERYNKSDKEKKAIDINSFVTNDNPNLKWDRELKKYLKRGLQFPYDKENVYTAMYRPFIKKLLYFHKRLNAMVYQLPKIFPTGYSENRVICLTAPGEASLFFVLMTVSIADLHLTATSQCFPLYSYNEDGTGKKDNITDFALEQFRTFYESSSISKEDIFYYTYALLHLEEYRYKYKENLKISLPRIPFISKHPYIKSKAKVFASLSELGRELGEIHINYEDADEYEGLNIKADHPLNYNVEKMRWNRGKSILKYNSKITISGFPQECFEYRLGNRSPIEWVADQYKDWNENSDYVLSLIKKLVTVSLSSLRIINKINEHKL